MPLSADALLDRMRLKSEIVKWRTLAIVAATLLAAAIIVRASGVSNPSGDHIARINIDGIILEDQQRLEKIKKLKKNNNVKAVIVYINSPGGTMVGGETLYTTLRELSAAKPTAAVMGSLAASGGYMAALGADKIFAHAGTLTGSIGVIMQTAEVSDLTDKIGITFNTFKSGDLKGEPSPFEKLSPKVEDVINRSIEDSYDFFVDLVKERRHIANENIAKIADGRIFTGRQAMKNDLVDSLGGENAAINWLATEKNIDRNLPVKDIKMDDLPMWARQLSSKYLGGIFTKARGDLNGLLALWEPNLF